MKINQIGSAATQALQSPQRTQQTPTPTPTDGAIPEVGGTADQSEVSSEAQQISGTDGSSSSESVQGLVEQLKSDVEAVQSEQQTAGSQSQATDSTAKTQLAETYEKVSVAGELSQVDATTRQSSEQILGLSLGSGSNAASVANTSESGTAQTADQTAGSGYSQGVKTSLDSLLGTQGAA